MWDTKLYCSRDLEVSNGSLAMQMIKILLSDLGCMRSSTVRDTVTRQTSGPVVSAFLLFSVETFLSKRGSVDIRIIWTQD